MPAIGFVRQPQSGHYACMRVRRLWAALLLGGVVLVDCSGTHHSAAAARKPATSGQSLLAPTTSTTVRLSSCGPNLGAQLKARQIAALQDAVAGTRGRVNNLDRLLVAAIAEKSRDVSQLKAQRQITLDLLSSVTRAFRSIEAEPDQWFATSEVCLISGK